jgi:hypothetical protein
MNPARQRSCTFKRPYATESEAQVDVKAIRKAGSMAGFSTIHAYKCRFCPHWHIGHSKKRK